MQPNTLYQHKLHTHLETFQKFTKTFSKTSQILRLNGKVTEVERLVGDKENQIYVLSNEVKSVREELKTSLNLKEEQITEIKLDFYKYS